MPVLVKDSRGRSPFWICCYTTADGRRLKKSTKQREKSRALEICLSLERAEAAAARGVLTEARARELIGEVLERTSGEKIAFYSAETWLREWLRGKEISKTTATHTKYSNTVENFLARLGSRAKLNIAAITPKDVSDFRDTEIQSGKHPNTVRFAIKHLRIPFTIARRQGLITHNPAEAVELPPVPKTSNEGTPGRDVFTPAQISALMRAAVAEENGRPVFKSGYNWKGAVLLAYFTGARLQDVANMTWKEVHLKEGVIIYVAGKTGKKVTIPIHPQLATFFEAVPEPPMQTTFLFPLLAGRQTGGKSGLSMAFGRIMARAGIKGQVVHAKREGGAGRTVNSLSFHSLRHSFNSAMANAGISQEIRMQLTGHMSVEMNKGYTHINLEPLRAAVATIPILSHS